MRLHVKRTRLRSFGPKLEPPESLSDISFLSSFVLRITVFSLL